MLEPIIVQILLSIGLLLPLSATIYAKINKTRKQKSISQQINPNQKPTIGQTRIMSQIGLIAGHLITILVILNIFLYDEINQYIPHLDFLFLSTFLQIIGFIFILIGTGIFLVCYKTLGVNWIDSDQKRGLIPLPAEQELVQTGIYKYVRNPIYCSTCLICGGYTLLLLDGLVLILYIIYVIGMYFLVLDEEKTLQTHFGEQYTKYLQHTGRFFPKLNK